MLLGLLANLWTVPVLVLLFGLTILVHELGHFLAARRLGLVAEVFSIGFGPALLRWRRGGTLYKIGCIPFGGYVALPQLDPSGMSRIQGGEDAGEDAGERRLPPVAAWRRMVVSVAGAVGNLLLAAALAWIVYWVGIPGGPGERASVVGYVAADSAAAAAGLRAGDEIVAVNDRPVSTWSDLRVEVALHEAVSLRVRRPDGAETVLEVATGKGAFGERALEGVDGEDLCEVLQVVEGSSADKAGVLPGDRITGLDGTPVYSRLQLIELVAERAGRTVPLVVERGEGGGVSSVVLSVTPEPDPDLGRARVGVVFNTMAVEEGTLVHPKPLAQLKRHASMIFRVLGALVTPRQSHAASQAVGGPVAIVVSYWVIVRTSLMLALSFTCMLNMNLAILNLLPIPVLDGGHLVFQLYEIIARRPPPPRVVNGLVNLFAVLLIAVMILLSMRDVKRLTPVGRRVAGWFGRGSGEEAQHGDPAPADPAD